MKCLWILAQRWFSEIYLAQFWHSWRRLRRAQVPLAKQLCQPLGGYAARTEASGIRGSQIVNPKLRNLCSSEGRWPTVFSSTWGAVGFKSLGNRNGPSPAIAN